MKKRSKIALAALLLLVIGVILFKKESDSKDKTALVNINIEEVLKTDAYSYLPEKAKDYIREVYNDEGIILHTEKNKEKNIEYLNPAYIEYLTRNEEVAVIPSSTIVDFVPGIVKNAENLPSKFDLRDVDGKNYVTPFKNQGSEGLCWAYATNATIESHLLKVNNKEYDETASIISEQQLDYATASNGTEIDNHIYVNKRELSSGGNFADAEKVMLDGLAIVQRRWDQEHVNQISNKSPIALEDIYNFDNSLYELNGTYHFPTINFNTASEEDKTSYINAIKENIIEYGGAMVGTDISNGNKNLYNGEWVRVVNQKPGSKSFMPEPHGMEIIGWDDDFEYVTCNHLYKGNAPNDCPNDYRTGKGVWILKNSWGDQREPIIYLAYESYETDINFVRDLSVRSWDNFYHTKFTSINSTTGKYELQNNTFVKNEKINKIKAILPQNANNKFYLSNDKGSSYTLIGEIDSLYNGFYALDIASKALDYNNESIIKVVTNGRITSIKDIRVYTNNITETKDIYSEDYEYKGFLNNSKQFDFPIYTQTKNLSNSTPLSIKIKNSSNEYMPEDSYSFSPNKVYANINHAYLRVNADYFSKGVYTVEVYYADEMFKTFTLNITKDLIVTGGEGTSENPWEIYNTWQFDYIRNHLNDSFILMSDLDFEYDTKNKNGLFYNDGLGFEPIKGFKGFLDGNNHKIKNLYSSSLYSTELNKELRSGGIFESANFYKCPLTKCGFKNITVENPEIKDSNVAGGFINYLEADEPEKLVFENIFVQGGSVSALSGRSYAIGGVIGQLYFYSEDNKANTINNLFNSSTINGASVKSSNNFLAGVIGEITSDACGKLIIKNIMNVGKINSPIDSDLAGGTINILGAIDSEIDLKNIISLNNSYDAIGVPPEIEDYSDALEVSIENVYTNAGSNYNTEYLEQYLVKSNNIISGKSIYELANSNYSTWADFNSNWTQYNDDGIKRIPVLKNVSYDYFGMNNEISINVNGTYDILNLVTNNKNNNDIEILKNCDYDLDVCNNTTNEQIISLEGTAIKGLKAGKTTIIVGNKHDGYIDVVNVNVEDRKEITFNANGGKGEMSKQIFLAGNEVTLATNIFTKADYRFDHWNTKADDTGTSYIDGQKITLDDNVELFAIWKSIMLNVTFDANGGTGTMANQSVETGKPFTLEPNGFERKDYSFVEWNTKADGTGTSYSSSASLTLDDDITLYAIWKKVKFYVYFDANGGNGMMSQQEFKEGDEITLYENIFTRFEYLFVHWNTKADNTGTSYTDGQKVTLDDDVTLYAIWEEADFHVTFKENGGTGFMARQGFITDTEITLDINKYTKEDYTFDHWNTKADDTGTSYTDGQKVTLDGDVTLYAIWVKNTLYITFDANGGTGTMEPQEFQRGIEQSIKPNLFTREHYQFSNWNTKPDNTGDAYFPEQSIIIKQDLTLYAIYSINYYYISHDLNGGEGIYDFKKPFGTILENPGTPTRDGYIFAGWFADENLTTPFEFGKPLTSNVILYAKWRQPVVTWNINGGTPKSDFVSDETHPVDHELVLPSKEELKVNAPKGYELDAYELTGARFLPGQTKTIDDDITIKILWKKIILPDPEESYVIKFKGNKEEKELVDNNTNLNNYIANKKSEFATAINEFKNGKENTSIDNYNNLFTNNSYALFEKFTLKNTNRNEEENTITYEYEVLYTKVNVRKESNKYKLEKVQEDQEQLDFKTNIEDYINTKKEEFKNKVKDIDINDLFIVNKEKEIYQYPVFIDKVLTDSKEDEENSTITNYYSYNYKLVSIVLVKEYELNENDNIISFKDKTGIDFKFNIISIINNIDSNAINKAKKLVNKKEKLIDYYRITVTNGNQEKHKGPFELKLKITDNMQKFKKIYLLCISGEKEEKPIYLTKEGKYLTGSLEHLSDYILVGIEDEVNPETKDSILTYIVISLLIFTIIVLSKNILKIKRYN